jgi:hypothetical protein
MKKSIISLLFLALIGIAATRVPFYSSGPTLVLSGSVVMSGDGSVTQSFSTAFSAVPTVLVCQENVAAGSLTNIIAPTTSNVVIRSSIAGATNKWIAIGTP